MQNNVINPKFNGESIQKCGFNIEELILEIYLLIKIKIKHSFYTIIQTQKPLISISSNPIFNQRRTRRYSKQRFNRTKRP